MIAAGVGFRRGASAEEVAALVRGALAALEPGAEALAALATAEQRAGEAPFRGAAALLGVTPVAVEAEALRAAGPGCLTRSPRALALHGVGSLCEAAALAAAGPGARLLGVRVAGARVACALAHGLGPLPGGGA